MTNRLGALRSKSGVSGDKPPPVQVSPNDPFANFWNNYNSVQSKIDDIDETLNDIQALDDDLQKIQDQEEATEKHEELKEKLGSITGKANQIRQDIAKLRENVDNLADEYPGSAQVRLQRNHLHVLSNNFAEVINRFTTIQEETKQKFAKQVSRHYAIAGIKLDDDMVQKIITENPDALQQSVFQIQGQSAATEEIVDTYNKIAARHEDILSIEKSLSDLMELFVQFSILIKDQGRQIDNIEANIAQATDYVQRGVQHLEAAREHQKKSRKCLWIGIGIAVVVLVVLIIVVVMTTKNKK